MGGAPGFSFVFLFLSFFSSSNKTFWAKTGGIQKMVWGLFSLWGQGGVAQLGWIAFLKKKKKKKQLGDGLYFFF